MQAPPESFHSLLVATAQARNRQADIAALGPNERRHAVAPELLNFVGSTRWPHDNTPLPPYLEHHARRCPTHHVPEFDSMADKEPLPMNERTKIRFFAWCCGLLALPVACILFWLLLWCPENGHMIPQQSTPAVLLPSECTYKGRVESGDLGFNITSACAPPPEVLFIEDERSCSAPFWRYFVLSLFILFMGCPGLCCLQVVVRLSMELAVYFLCPLNQQLYFNYPEVSLGVPPIALVDHVRALTLLHTVDRLSRQPVEGTRRTWWSMVAWSCSSMYHYQWARHEGESVWRFDVQPNGSVEYKSAARNPGCGFYHFYVRISQSFFRTLDRCGLKC